jgi:hypothetical protein
MRISHCNNAAFALFCPVNVHSTSGKPQGACQFTCQRPVELLTNQGGKIHEIP